MCDFKPGDEVVCVNATPRQTCVEYLPTSPVLVVGTIYTVKEIWAGHPAGLSVRLHEVRNANSFSEVDWGFCPSRFRKVQRRDLTAWLATTNTIEEPKRKPAKAPA